MNRKTNRALLFILVFALALAGCQRVDNSQIPEPEYTSQDQAQSYALDNMDKLLDYANARHRAVEKPDVDFQQIIQGFAENQFPYWEYGQEQEFDPLAQFTMEQAEEDMDILFQLLKGVYGPYSYFGGDEVFEAAHKAVLQDCQATLDREGALTGAEIKAAVVEHLSFIKDGHFTVDGTRFYTTQNPYFYKEIAFQPTSQGYRAEDGRLVSGVEGYADLDELFKPSISQEGEVVHYPVVLAAQTPSALTVRFDNGEEQVLSPTDWTQYYEDSDRMVEVTQKDGIPVLFVRNMGFDHAEGDTLGTDFMRYAQELKDEPVLVVDLRSNGGGNGILPLKWLKAYAGSFVPTNYVSIDYMTEEALYNYGTNTENRYYIPYDELIEFGANEAISDSYMKSNHQPDDFVDNDRLMVILTGKSTGSAAETFVDAAHNLENTLIVGTNTYGVLLSNAFTWVYLPNSGIQIQLGSNLCIFPEGHFEEYQGFQPDLWVDAAEAEELVGKLINNYLKDEE